MPNQDRKSRSRSRNRGSRSGHGAAHSSDGNSGSRRRKSHSRRISKRHNSPNNMLTEQMQQILNCLTVLEGQRSSSPPRTHEPSAGVPALTPPRLRPLTTTVVEHQRSVLEGRESAVTSSPGRPVSAITDRDASGTDRIIDAIRSINTTIMPPRKKLTREEHLEKKRLAERLRYQRIKNDPEKYSQQKEKEKKKYERKKEKGTIKTVNQMTPREQRKARKIWREKAKQRRRRLALQHIENAPATIPTSDNENINQRAQAGQRRSIQARRARNILIKKQVAQIAQLKSTIQCYKKRLQRSKRQNNMEIEKSPGTRVSALLSSPKSRDTVKKKILCGEVLSQQLRDNFSDLTTQKEQRLFQISGKLVSKYRVLEEDKILKPIQKRKTKLTLIEAKRSIRKKSIILRKTIEIFMEEDSNSRVCAGKKDVVTKQGVRKQMRVMLDTLINLYKLFIKKNGIKISYALFCKFRPFWVVQSRYDKRNTCLCVKHSNIELILNCLHQAKIISVLNYVDLLNTFCCNRYNEDCLSRNCETCKNKTLCYKEFDNSFPLLYKKWQSVPQDYVDVKTKKTRKIMKCVKSTIEIYPRDLILQLESNTEILLLHEFNIVHQYMAMKLKKETLTERDAIIHVDFSKKYQTKYAEEVQSFHFGGSREQISIHTVVVYTKGNNGDTMFLLLHLIEKFITFTTSNLGTFAAYTRQSSRTNRKLEFPK
ncbi:unnamed protein product, partial [Brenthis ino]